MTAIQTDPDRARIDGAVWEVRGFSHSDYPDVPSDFDLYRRDNEVSGGSFNADFDAWLVRR